MGSILFGNNKNIVSAVISWIVVILAMSQIADIAAYYGQTQIQNFFITIIAVPFVAAICFVLFRIIVPPKKQVYLEEAIEEQKEGIDLARIYLDTGEMLILNREDPEIDTTRVKSIIKNYGHQSEAVWKSLLNAYNSKKFSKFGILKGYCMTQINKQKKPLKVGESYEF